jgi:hypothetical protein
MSFCRLTHDFFTAAPSIHSTESSFSHHSSLVYSRLCSFRWLSDKPRPRSAPPAADFAPEPAMYEPRVVHPDPHYDDAPLPETEYDRRYRLDEG